MKPLHVITNLHFTGERMSITIDGEQKQFDLNIISKPLLRATDAERMKFEISPSGYGVHWPMIDEDLSIDGLLGVAHLPLRDSVIKSK